jgi:tetratricopeptide (TPR) repeat protein
MVNDYRPDHSFRVPRPDQSVKYDVPNACNKCHDNKSAQWAAEWVVKWYGQERRPHFSDVLLKAANHESSPKEIEHFAKIDTVPDIAKATAIYYLNYYGGPEAAQTLLNNLTHPSVLIRRTAVEGLGMYDVENLKTALLPILFDTSRVVRQAVFNVLAGIDISSSAPNVVAQYQKVGDEFFDTHKINADFPSQKLNMAQYYQRTGQTGLAQHYYEETLAKDNYQNMARVNLAIIYNSQQKNQQAAALLKKVIEQEPNYDPAYFSLGLLYAEINRADSAIFYLKECTKVNAQNYGAYYNLGLLYQQQNQMDKAEKTFLDGIKGDPNNERLLYAITSFYLKNEKKMKASQYAEKLAKLYPNRQEYLQLLQMTEN